MAIFSMEFNVDNEVFHREDQPPDIVDEDAVAGIIVDVGVKVKLGTLEGGIMDPNGNKIGTFGIVP